MDLNLDREAALLETIFFWKPNLLMSLHPFQDKRPRKRCCRSNPGSSQGNTLAGPNHGLELVQVGGGWILAPKRELWIGLKDRYGKKNEQKLSRAAMETLSIIAYSQPITRAEIEAIRGVSADNMIRFLVEKEFIKEVGKKGCTRKPCAVRYDQGLS
jgi:segregation and condensation protein B